MESAPGAVTASPTADAIGEGDGDQPGVAPGPAPTDRALIQCDRISHEHVDLAVLRLNRPEQLNPLDKQTIRELRRLLTGLTAEGGPDGIVLTGNGDAFSAGGDLKGYQSLFTDPDEFRQFMRDFDEVCGLLESASAITVAMVNGTCVAGGLELALACDLITMSADAEIGDGHLKFGQLPGAGSSQRLVRAIGLQQARNWLLTARLFTAEEAAASGLVCLVTPPGELAKQTFELTAQAAAHTPLGRAHMKDLLRTAVSTPLAEGLRYEQDVAHRYATTSHDAAEGLRAFAERRSARYRGR